MLDTLPVERCHLVGTAAGGLVALDFANSFPERVKTLTVANSVYGITDASDAKLRENLRVGSVVTAGVGADFVELGPSYRAMSPEGVDCWLAAAKQHPAGSPNPSAAASCLLPSKR